MMADAVPFTIEGREVAYAEIIPHGDIAPHDLEEFCECQPNVYTTDDGLRVIEHHSFDGREDTDN